MSLRAHLRNIAWGLSYGRARELRSELRKRWVVFSHPRAVIRFGPGVFVGPGFSLDIPENGTFVAGANCEFRRGFRAEVAGNGRISFGEGCTCTYYVLMQCTTSIDVGDRCMFGQSTIVLDGQHRFRDLDRPMLEQGYDFEPIVIEDDVTITSKCTIMARVGRRALVGANAVVSRPVPPFTVAVGAPARPVDYFGPPGGEPPGVPATSSS